MAFLISSVLSGDSALQLSDADFASEENAFTIIVGKNATGKSRLLRKVVSAFVQNSKTSLRPIFYIERNMHDGFYNDVVLTHGSIDVPTTVIAVSTGRHDRFPAKAANLDYPRYKYITSPEAVGGSLSESLTLLFEKVLHRHHDMSVLGKVLEKLEFAPFLSFRVATTDLAKKVLSELESADHTLWGRNFLDFNELGINANYVYENMYDLERLERQKKLNVEVDIGSGIVSVNTKISSYKVYEMLCLGLLSMDGLTLIEMKDKRRIRYGMASSGQRCVLSMLLGIAGAITDNSLICIDEPEISLHPKWQEEIIDLLQVCFKQYKGCHFLIATHSPQVVSGMVSGLGFVLDIEDGKLFFPEQYANRSADYQLAQIFHTPGRANEYMIRISLMLISKLNRNESFSLEDDARFEWLRSTRDMLDFEDPVYHLIEQLDLLVRAR